MISTNLGPTPSQCIPVGVEIDVNALPEKSLWPAKLLEDSKTVFQKTKREIIREFNDEKWGDLLTKLSELVSPDHDALKQLMFSESEECVYSFDGRLFVSTPRLIDQLYKRLVARELAETAAAARVIIEIGSGTGNLIIHLARQSSTGDLYKAFELTASGREITRIVASQERLNIETQFLDFDQPALTAQEFNGAIIFSSFAVVYCKQPENLLRAILREKPSEIILIEPIFQFFDSETLTGLLAKKYFKVNDYCDQLYPAIQSLESQGFVKCVAVNKNVFGHNPLCPVSLMRLRPV